MSAVRIVPAGSPRPSRSPLRIQGMRTTFVTLDTCAGEPVFKDAALVEQHLKVLREISDKLDTPIICYCYLPDHVHLMVASDNPRQLSAMVRAYKRRTWAAYRREFRKPLWERKASHYRLKKDEDLMRFAQYILENPVRAGLVNDYREYPYSGSFLWELKVHESHDVDGLHPVAPESSPEAP